MEIVPIVAMLSFAAAAVLIVFLVGKSRQRRAEIHSELQSRLIDRFGSGTELAEFLQSPAGRQFVTGVRTAPMAIAHDRIVAGFTRAIVLTALGCAFLFLTFFYEDGFAIPAAILFALGIGYLVATFVSYKLSGSLMQRDVTAPPVPTEIHQA